MRMVKGTVNTFRRDNSVRSVLFPFCKGVHSRKKEFALLGNKFFPFRVDHFQKELDLQEIK